MGGAKMMQFKKHITELIIVIIMFFSPIHAAILSVFSLGVFDFITGVLASYKRGDKITSRRMFDSIVKITIYSILLCASHIIEVHLITYLPLVKLATSAIAFTELKSLYENIGSILQVDLYGYLKDFLDKRTNKP
jgi:uncharacterized membrane protein HdeD (DUF308 family)